jgi:DNA-binding MarR family transcriptional regulator
MTGEQETDASVHLAESFRGALGKMNRRLREEGSAGDFTESQKAVLGRLERDGASTPSALARAEGMRPQSMGTIISALAAMGVVSTSPHPTDGRQTVVSLTDAAVELLRSGRAARQDWLSRSIHAHLSAAEQKQLADATELMKRLLDE